MTGGAEEQSLVPREPPMGTGGFICSWRSWKFPRKATLDLGVRGTLSLENSPQSSKTLWWEEVEHQGPKGSRRWLVQGEGDGIWVAKEPRQRTLVGHGKVFLFRFKSLSQSAIGKLVVGR